MKKAPDEFSRQNMASRISNLEDERDSLKEQLAAAMSAFTTHALSDYERKLSRQQIFALEDGLRGWKEVAADLGKKLEDQTKLEYAVAEICGVIDMYEPHLCGTVAERVNQVIKLAVKRKLQLEACKKALRSVDFNASEAEIEEGTRWDNIHAALKPILDIMRGDEEEIDE